MFESPLDTNDENASRWQVQAGLDAAKAFAKTIGIQQMESGEWFHELFKKEIASHDHQAKQAHFKKKYPNLSPDVIADRLIAAAARNAAIIGAKSGAEFVGEEMIASMIGKLSSYIGVDEETLYMTEMQMRLVLDLSAVYDMPLDLENSEALLAIFGYTLGFAPTGSMSDSLQSAAQNTTKRTLKSFFSKDRLKTTKNMASSFGLKVTQRSILVYGVLAVASSVNSSVNYISIRSVGKVAKTYFKNKGRIADEEKILAIQNSDDLVFPAAALYMARIDGEVTPREEELYDGLLAGMSISEYGDEAIQELVASEADILDAIAEIDDSEVRSSLIDVLILMAVYDGDLSEEEREFLIKVAGHLGVELDMAEIDRKVLDYEQLLKAGIIERTREISQAAYNRTLELGNQSTEAVRRRASDAAASLGSASEKMKDRWGKFRKRGEDEE